MTQIAREKRLLINLERDDLRFANATFVVWPIARAKTNVVSSIISQSNDDFRLCWDVLHDVFDAILTAALRNARCTQNDRNADCRGDGPATDTYDVHGYTLDII
jgi:hypothetical protein